MAPADLSTVHGETGFGPVEWRVREPEPFRRCSYCGSLHPEDFLAAAKAGAQVDRRVDWKYGWPHKVYIDVPVSDPTMLFYVGSSHGGDPDREPDPGYVRAADLTAEQIAILRRDGAWRVGDEKSSTSSYRFGPKASHFGKFYNVHQAEPWVTEELRQAIGFYTGFVITDAGHGKIRWRVFDYEETS